MLNRTKATVIGYVGTTLSFMNNKETWLFALQLAQCELGEIDSFLKDLRAEVKEELEPLIDVIRDPLKLINKDEHNDDDVDFLRNFILKKIKLGAEDLLNNPPPPSSDKNLSLFCESVRRQQDQLRISPTTGQDRSNNISSSAETNQLAWFHTSVGQRYLFNIQASPSDVRVAFNSGVNQATEIHSLLRHIVAPHQQPIAQYLRSLFPNYPIINDQLVAITFVLSFIYRISTFIIGAPIVGIPIATSAVFFDAMWSRENELIHQLHLNTYLTNSDHQLFGSFWQNPRDADHVIIRNITPSDEESEEDRNLPGLD